MAVTSVPLLVWVITGILVLGFPLMYLGFRSERTLMQAQIRMLRTDLEKFQGKMDGSLNDAVNSIKGNAVSRREAAQGHLECTAALEKTKGELKLAKLELEFCKKQPGANTDKLEQSINATKCSQIPRDLPEGHLAQHVFKLKADEPIPLINKEWHPWRAETRNYMPVQLFSKDKKVQNGDYSSCTSIDIFFHALGTQHGANRCLMMVPHRSVKTHLMSFTKSKDQDEFEWEDPKRWEGEHLLRQGHLDARNKILGDYFAGFSEMIVQLKSLTSSHPIKSSLLVMAANDGHVPLLLNFACSLRKTKIPLPPHIVFVTSHDLVKSLTALGFTAFYHSALGDFPTGAASVYGDRKFGSMMFMKQFSVHLALELKRDVLFQDLDVTWLKNPMEDLAKSSEMFDVQIQDDGARNERFQPYWANSGFYYLRNNDVVRTMWDRVTMSLHPFNQGNQATMNMVMQAFVMRRGLKVRVLPKKTYVAGSGLSHPHFLVDGRERLELDDSAEILHFCWTHNITHKFHKMELYDQLFITPDCFHDSTKCFSARPSMDEICQI